MNEPLTFVLVGAGAIAQSYVQALTSTELARLVAVVDTRPEAAKTAAEASGARPFATCEEALLATNPDAAIVCTPPSTHPELCIRLLEKGVHVLCEKPLAVGYTNARRMVDAAARCGVLLTMGSKFRYVEDMVRAKSIVSSGVLGEIILFENTFTSRVDMSKRWNSNPRVSGGGVLIDNGTHSVDLIRYFLGPIAEVQAVEGKRLQGLEVEDTARLFVRSQSGVMASVDLSWSLNKERDSYLDIYGSAGIVRVGWKESKYQQASSPGWVVFANGYDKQAAFRRQLENFCNAIVGEERLLITSDDALASVQVMEAAYQSLAKTHWVWVDAKDKAA
jgi:predicted dehydrogenase